VLSRLTASYRDLGKSALEVRYTYEGASLAKQKGIFTLTCNPKLSVCAVGQLGFCLCSEEKFCGQPKQVNKLRCTGMLCCYSTVFRLCWVSDTAWRLILGKASKIMIKTISYSIPNNCTYGNILYLFIVHSPIVAAVFSHFQEELNHKGNAMLL